MPMKFYATPDPAAAGMGGNGLGDYYRRSGAAAAAAGHNHADAWANLATLFTKIKNELDANNFDCMALLEIDAHGSPGTCDGVLASGAAAFGALLRTVRLCDNVDIFLSGCNTGVRTATSESLAQIVSRHTPTEAADRVRVNVWGAVGYISGNHMQGTANSARDCRVDCHYYPPYPPSTNPNGTPAPGSSAGSGAAAFRGYREGNAL